LESKNREKEYNQLEIFIGKLVSLQLWRLVYTMSISQYTVP